MFKKIKKLFKKDHARIISPGEILQFSVSASDADIVDFKTGKPLKLQDLFTQNLI